MDFSETASEGTFRGPAKSQRTQVDDVTSDEDEDSESSGDAAIVDIRTGAEHRDGFIIFEDYDENVIACLEEIPQLQILRYVVLFLAHKFSLKHTTYTHY